jgi:hypothetical protein
MRKNLKITLEVDVDLDTWIREAGVSEEEAVEQAEAWVPERLMVGGLDSLEGVTVDSIETEWADA